MTRRDFFRATALGGATVPSVLATVTKPPVWSVIYLTPGTYDNVVIRALGIVLERGSCVIRNMTLRSPWNHPWKYGAEFRVGSHARLHMDGFVFARDATPFWARLLRLDA